MNMEIPFKDRERLRKLAGECAETAAGPAMSALRRDWVRHGRFESGSRPMVRVEPYGMSEEVIDPFMLCESPQARSMEREMLYRLIPFREFGDDTLVDPWFSVPLKTSFVPFDLPVRRRETGGVGYQYIPYLHDLEEDLGALRPSTFTVDTDGTERDAEEVYAAIGDILPPKIVGKSLRVSLTKDIVSIMSMEDMYYAMIDCPDAFREMLGRLTDDYHRYFSELEGRKALFSTCGSEYLFQGSYCFTDELPKEKPDRVKQIWGYMDSQETSAISPQMFSEQLFPHYRGLSDVFGLLSYGCCEPVHALWSSCIGTMPNLRKVSISPWCDEEAMGLALKGKRTVYLRKPDSTLLGDPDGLDGERIMRYFRKTSKASEGCCLEIVQRDVYRIFGTVEKVRRYVEMIRSAVESHCF